MSDEMQAAEAVPADAPVMGQSVPLTWPGEGPQPHRFAGMFRMLTPEERVAFDEDIRERGLLNKIVIFQDQILDGRNRYLALVESGWFDEDGEEGVDDWRDWPEFFTEFEGDEAEALEYAWSLNEQRRHDNPTQRATAAARYANLRDVTLKEAAEKFAVSERQVSSAQHVLEHGVPELEEAMEQGRIPAYLAEQVADLDEDEQRDVVAAEKPARAAREKLQEPPPLATSGEVVKPIDAAVFVAFAEAVLKVGALGHAATPDILNRLAFEHQLLADQDGVLNLNRPARLAIELARKKLMIADGQWRGMSALIIGSAGLPDDFDELCQAYRNAIVLYDRAVRGKDAQRQADYSVAMEAILLKAGDRASEVQAAARAPDGTVPMWGQQGCFIAEAIVSGVKVRAIVSMGRWPAIYAVDAGEPFPSETGFLSCSPHDAVAQSVEHWAGLLIVFAVAGRDRSRPMPLPQKVYTLREGATTGPIAVDPAGQELDRSAYDAALAALTEPRGQLHQSTAEAAIRAGVACGISRTQMAEDLGHPTGTIKTWTARLGLTDGSRKAAE